MSNYPRNEADLVRAIVRELEKSFDKLWILKTHGNGYQRVGVPDLLICYRGQLIALEVKHRKPGESLERMYSRVSPNQQKEIQDLQHAGARARVIYTVEEAIAELREISGDSE